MYHSEFISFHANVMSNYNHILRFYAVCSHGTLEIMRILVRVIHEYINNSGSAAHAPHNTRGILNENFTEFRFELK
jgi:hypothetical protein